MDLSETKLINHHNAVLDEQKTRDFILQNLPMFDIVEVCYSTFWLQKK